MLTFSSLINSFAILALLLGLGLLLTKITEKPRIPDVVVFLLMGILLGSQVLHVIDVPQVSLVNQWILTMGAIIILFDGGRQVSLSILSKTWLTVTLLSTVGVVITALVLAITAQSLFHLSFSDALLLGAVLSSTDPATLIPVFRRVPVIARLGQTLEAESAFNDATAAVLVVSIVHSLMGKSLTVTYLISHFVLNAGIGIAVGFAVGFISLHLITQVKSGFLREYASIVIFLCAMGAYLLATVWDGSGFMATFVAGIVTGNEKSFRADLHALTKAHVDHFFSALGLVFRILIFMLLGSQVVFASMVPNIGSLLLIVLVLMFVARPLTVLTSVLPDRRAKFKLPEILLMSWVRETGVLPAALSGMLVASHVPKAMLIESVTFLAILMTILIQATSMPYVAQKLKVTVPFVEEEI